MLGLTARQLICAIISVALAAGLYLGLKDTLGKDNASWICLLAAAPFTAAGFFRYNSMNFEQFVFAWFKASFLCGGNRGFHSENVHYAALGRKERDDFD